MRTQTDPYKINIPDALEDVREFMTQISERTGRWMPGKPGSFADVRLSRACMIFEEYRETREAIDAGDTQGELDGMVDLLYVVLGGAVELDEQCDDWDGRHYNVVMVEQIMAEAFEALQNRFCWSVEDVVHDWCQVADLSGLPVGAAWNEVHAANMRKFQGGHYDAAAGKWKKPADWVGPDIAGVLAKYPRITR